MKGYDIAAIIGQVFGLPGYAIHSVGDVIDKSSAIVQNTTSSQGGSYGVDNDYMKKLEEMVASDRVWNSAEAQKNRDWQERMANTAVQRSVGDIQQAGLNPWLAVQGSSALSGGSYSGAQAESSSSSAFANLLASNMSNQNKLLQTLINGLVGAFNTASKIVATAAAA